MIRRPPRSTSTDTPCPTRRSSDLDELFRQTRAVVVADPVESKKFTKRIAFNVIPHIDSFMEDGYTKEEWKVIAETKKMLDRSEEHTSELQSLMRISYPVYCLNKKTQQQREPIITILS